MTISSLINFIDCHTNNGAIYPNELQEENIRLEEGIAFIRSFYSADWLALRDLNLEEKSNLWVECLINLLNEAYTEEARQIIIHIALTGTEDNFFKAMKCIRNFRRDVDIYTWLKLKNRSAEISKGRLKSY